MSAPRSRRQAELRFHRRGGRRPGAGRKPTGPRAGLPHRRRPRLDHHHPVHVTLRVVAEAGRLRRRRAYACVNRALETSVRRHDFRVVHVSIQATHLHLLVEAADARALANGVRGFEISAAQRLNRARGRRGRVFADRYHAEIITSRRQARHALAYVLNNWRRHREDRGSRARLDPYSSAIAFPGWRGHQDRVGFALPRGYEALTVAYPTVWLLRVGWRLYGPIDVRERPGARD